MWYGWAEAAGNKWNRANQSKARHKLHEDEEGYSGGLMVKIWHSRRWSSIGMERSLTFCSCPLSTNNKHRHNINLCYVFVLVLYGPVFSNLEEARKTFNCLKLCRGKSPSKNVFIIVTFLRIMPPHNRHLMYVDILIYNLPFCLRSRVVSASIAQPGSDTRYSTVRLPESL